MVTVGEVKPGYVKAGFYQLLDLLGRIGGGADGGHNFGAAWHIGLPPNHMNPQRLSYTMIPQTAVGNVI
jgi:hypothetical protein